MCEDFEHFYFQITDLFRLLQQIPKEKRGKSLDLIQNCTLLIKDDESEEQTSQLRGHLDSQVESKLVFKIYNLMLIPLLSFFILLSLPRNTLCVLTIDPYIYHIQMK